MLSSTCRDGTINRPTDFSSSPSDTTNNTVDCELAHLCSRDTSLIEQVCYSIGMIPTGIRIEYGFYYQLQDLSALTPELHYVSHSSRSVIVGVPQQQQYHSRCAIAVAVACTIAVAVSQYMYHNSSSFIVDVPQQWQFHSTCTIAVEVVQQMCYHSSSVIVDVLLVISEVQPYHYLCQGLSHIICQQPGMQLAYNYN